MELPLFPLNAVLFPGARMPLHIFEERYKEMISECIEDRRPFGVLLIRSGQETGGEADAFDIGTTAHIASVDRLDDGKMNLMCVGGQRFRVLETVPGAPYRKGHVELLQTRAESGPETSALADETGALFAEYTRLYLAVTNQWARTIDLPSEPDPLADFVGSRLPIAALTKQKLLEQLSAKARLGMEKRLLGAAIRQMTSQLKTARDARWHGIAVMN